MQKKRIQMVAGNWKMNTDYDDGRDLAKAVVKKLRTTDVHVVLIPPYTHLKNVGNILSGLSNVGLGAQNCHEEEAGAYTGEISTLMLKSVGVNFIILGHSERRQHFKESDKLLAKKVNTVLAANLKPIFCCGESLKIRESKEHVSFVCTQIENSLFHLDADAFSQVILAYEPIWAIGTGKTASPKQAQDMHKAIRDHIASKYGAEVAELTTILYGGSCKPTNAKEIFANPDVDGGLIGGASLNADDFVEIIESF